MIIIAVVLLALLVAPAFAEAAYGRQPNGTWCVSSSPELSDHADPSAVGSLAWTLAQLGDPPATVEIPGATVYALERDLTVPANVSLRLQYGAVLSVAAGCTLTVDGGIEAGLQQVFSGEGLVTGAARIGSVLPQWFGAVGDGAADDTDALQHAVDFACRSRVLAADLNRGRYRITRTLDCTNTRQEGTILRDGLRIFGASFIGAAIIGDTGDGHAVIETSGSQWLELDNFVVGAGAENPSSVGIFTGCPRVLPQSQNHKYHVYISMHDDPLANGGLGTVGIWNFASEEHTYYAVYVNANRPVVLTAYNGTHGFEYGNSYVELLDVHSLGVTTFTGECFLVTLAKRAPAFTSIDVNSVHLQNTYIGNIGGTEGDNTVAFDMQGVMQGFTYAGTIEGLATFARVSGTLMSANVTCTFGGVADPSAPILSLVAPGGIVNSDLKFTLAVSPERPLLSATAADDTEPCRLANTTIKTTQPAEWATVPAQVVHDPADTSVLGL